MIKKNNVKSYDIVVVGLGTAGAVALITAAKSGLRVLGIECLNAMGGTGTKGMIFNYYFGSPGGVYEKINEKATELQNSVHSESPHIIGDAKAYVLDSYARQFGADIMYNTRVTDVYVTDNTVTGVRCFGNREFYEIKARYVIDCTGDAEVCRLAGCALRTGRDFDGQTQPFSNVAIAIKDGKLCTSAPDLGYIKQYDSEDVSEKTINSVAFTKVLHRTFGYDNKYITNAPILGIREGSTIIGEDNITFKAFLEEPKIKNPLFYAYSNVDNHSKDTAFEDDTLRDWYIVAGMWSICFSVGVPTGALIPKNFRGILVAGRCIAVDHNMSALVRMKRDMEKCGEAAATLACLSIAEGVAAADVDYESLAEQLKSTKCLDADNNIGYVKWTSGEKVIWPDNTEDIIEGLKGERPGFAIWSAKKIGAAIIPELKSCMNDSTNTNLRRHAALALGLLGDASCIDELERMVAERDCYIPKTSVKYNYMRAVSAIYLLGNLNSRDSVEILLDVIRTKGDFDSSHFIPDELHMKQADVRFQLISYAIVALSRISKHYPELKDGLRSEILQNIDGLDIWISLKANKHIEFDVVDKLKRYMDTAF